MVAACIFEGRHLNAHLISSQLTIPRIKSLRQCQKASLLKETLAGHVQEPFQLPSSSEMSGAIKQSTDRKARKMLQSGVSTIRYPISIQNK